MKSILKIFLATILLGLILTPAVSLAADDYGLTEAATKGGVPTQIGGAGNLSGAIGAVVSTGLALLGVLFFLLILYGGLIWMTALGDAAKVDKAKMILEAAIVGLVIVVSAYAISNFVFSEVVAPTATVAPTAPTQ